MHLQLYLALFVGAVATIEDLWRRQISNWIPLTALAGGFLLQMYEKGWGQGLLSAFLGSAAGFAVFFVFYWLGGMGGGDIKLMAGFGAMLGVSQLWQAAYLTALIGALLAIGWIAANGIWNAVRCRFVADAVKRKVEAIPYAPAITLGVWLVLVPQA